VEQMVGKQRLVVVEEVLEVVAEVGVTKQKK
jgi:hypothetical protein